MKTKNKPTIYQKNKTPTIYNTMIKNRYPLYQNIKYPNTPTQKNNFNPYPYRKIENIPYIPTKNNKLSLYPYHKAENILYPYLKNGI